MAYGLANTSNASLPHIIHLKNTVIKTRIILYTVLLIAAGFSASAQKTIYGVVHETPEAPIVGVIISALHCPDSTLTNALGEYQITVAENCSTLMFSWGELDLLEDIGDRQVINVVFSGEGKSMKPLSLNPRKDYPLGLQLTLAGHSLFAVTMNYFITPNQSIEAGICGRGIEIGARHYFSLHDEGENKALYMGAVTNLPIDGDWVLYIPFGYHILSHNGMAFSIELGGKTPLDFDQDLKIYDFLGFGINLGFQF